jgi:hypothetical protein
MRVSAPTRPMPRAISLPMASRMTAATTPASASVCWNSRRYRQPLVRGRVGSTRSACRAQSQQQACREPPSTAVQPRSRGHPSLPGAIAQIAQARDMAATYFDSTRSGSVRGDLPAPSSTTADARRTSAPGARPVLGRERDATATISEQGGGRGDLERDLAVQSGAGLVPRLARAVSRPAAGDDQFRRGSMQVHQAEELAQVLGPGRPPRVGCLRTFRQAVPRGSPTGRAPGACRPRRPTFRLI